MQKSTPSYGSIDNSLSNENVFFWGEVEVKKRFLGDWSGS